ncbi:hypothetical protein [Methylobacterium nodulans]|uniref:hypothetical protein n=1 Tax=Methylobacterium nodulans TaxID=114616 RepID=UPI0009FBC869
MIQQSLDPAVTVSGIARSLLVSWRRQLRRRTSRPNEVRLLPVAISVNALTPDQSQAGGLIPHRRCGRPDRDRARARSR